MVIKMYQIPQAEITIVVDNYPHPSKKIGTGWGLSIYVDLSNIGILFDTGPDPQLLAKNLNMLRIDLGKLKACVISHTHGDHLGGISHLSKIGQELDVYMPCNSYYRNFIERMGLKYKIAPNFEWIYPGVGLSGIIDHGIPEQALVLNIENFGLLILVGCSHPGIAEIVERIYEITGISVGGIIGGWHLGGYNPREILSILNRLIRFDPKFLMPIHCSGERVREILEMKYPNLYWRGHVGVKIVIDRGGYKIFE